MRCPGRTASASAITATMYGCEMVWACPVGRAARPYARRAARAAAPRATGQPHPRAPRDDQRARRRVRERTPPSLARVGLVEQSRVAARPPVALGRSEAELLAAPPRDGLQALSVEDDLGRR